LNTLDIDPRSGNSRLKAYGIKVVDYMLTENRRKNGLHTKYLNRPPQCEGWLLVQLSDGTYSEADDCARKPMDELSLAGATSMKLYDDRDEEKQSGSLS
jgi:hypothetical protein